MKPSTERLLREFWSWVSGKDVFISYSRRDGAQYALALASQLAQRGYACAIDQWGTRPGRTLPIEIRRVLHTSRSMVLVATAGAAESDSVAQEIHEFLQTNRLIVPVDLDGTYLTAPWWSAIEGLAFSVSDNQATPTADVVDRIINGLTFQTRDRRLRNIAYAIGGLIVLMVLGGAVGIREFSAATQQMSRKLAEQTVQTKKQVAIADAESKRASDLQTLSKGLQDELARGQVDLARLTREAKAQQLLSQQAQHKAEVAGVAQRRATAETLLVQADSMIRGDRRQGDATSAISTAYAAHALWPRSRAPAVVQEALQRLPYYRRIDLGSSLTLFPQGDDEDSLQLTSDAHRIVYQPKPSERSLVVANVDDSQQVGKLPLTEGQWLHAPPSYRGDLVVLRSRARVAGEPTDFQVFDISGPHLPKTPVLTVNGVLDFACTDGNFPCFSLTSDYSVVRYGAGGAQAIVATTRFSAKAYLSVAPQGQAVAVLERGHALILRFDEHAAQSQVDITWRSPSNDNQDELDERYGQVVWGPTADRLLLFPRSYFRYLEVIAISTDKGCATRLRLLPQSVTALDVVTAASPSLNTILVGLGGKKSGIYLIDLIWKNDGTASLAERKILAEGQASDYWQVGPAAFAPSGRIVAIVRSDGGGDRSVASWVETYDLEKEGFNAPFARDYISTNGSPVSRLAFSRDGSRLIAWRDSVAALIYRIRKSGMDDAISLPLVQISPLLPEDIAKRFSPPTFYTRDRHQSVVQYAANDLRVYDVTTGSERRIAGVETWIKDSDINEQGQLVLCDGHSLAVVDGNRVTRRSVLDTPLSKCSIDRSVTIGTTEKSLGLWSSNTLTKGPALLLALPASWIGWGRNANQVTAYVRSKDGDHFDRYVSELTNKNWGRFRADGSVKVVMNNQSEDPRRSSLFNWYCEGRLLVTRQWIGRFTSVLKIYDFQLGNVTDRYLPPRGGWPERIENVINLHTLSDGTFVLVLQVGCQEGGSGNCIAVGRWPVAGGKLLQWSVSKGIGSSRAILWDEDNLGGIVMAEEGDKAHWVRIPDGEVIGPFKLGNFSSLTFKPPPAWPVCTTSGWQLPGDGYTQVLDRIRLGGLDNASALVNMQLSKEQTEMIERTKQ